MGPQRLGLIAAPGGGHEHPLLRGNSSLPNWILERAYRYGQP